ncbi:MAG: ribose-phosphate pyrophosphokinase [Candidatus Levybacteria bacterium]|nr:ribose-phosphate pyrophosphokinase [Candidatus Levybacteria bacterium]
MKIFSGASNKPLAEKVAKLLNMSLSPIEHHTFPDGEQRVRLEEGVVGEDTVVIQPTGIPIDINYIELFFTIDALKRSGAKSVTVVIPYLGYERQDHVFRSGEARSLEVVIRTMENIGVDKFIAFDLHSIKTVEIFKEPITHLSALSLFANIIKDKQLIDAETVLVSPDMGGVRRVRMLSDMLRTVSVASIEKNRDLETGKITASVIHGNVMRRAIIIDDMISSGQTIAQAVTMLRERGTKEVWVFATHAVFSQNASTLLEKVEVEKIYVTDTLIVPENKRFRNLEILSVADMIAEQFKVQS